MNKYNEFAPQTYLNLTDGTTAFSINGILSWLLPALNFVTNQKWDHEKLISYLKSNQIDVISADHDEITFAINSLGNFKNEEDAELDKIELLSTENLTRLINLIDRTNNDNIYMEIMFKGFYLNLNTGKLFFELKELVNSYINNPYNVQGFKNIHSDVNDFRIFAKKNNIDIKYISDNEIQFLTLPEYVITRKNSDTLVPVDINSSTTSKVEVVDSSYLLKIGQVLNQLNKSQSNNKKDVTYLYYEISSGIIKDKKQDQLFYSVNYVLEALNRRIAQSAIRVGKNAIRKQIRKLLKNKPNQYQKIKILNSEIEMHDKKWLAKNNPEVYVNEALFKVILEYNFSKNMKDYPMHEPKFDIEIPLLEQSFLNVKLPGNGNCKINYASFEAVQVQINRFKRNVEDIIELKKQWLINKLNNINVKVNYNSVSTSVKWSKFIAFIDELEKNQLIVTPFDDYKQIDINILKNLKNIDSAKKDIGKLTLRKVFNVNLPEKLKNINKHKYDYSYTTDLSNKELQKISNYFGTNVKKTMDIVNKATQEVMKEMSKLDKI